MRRLCTVLVLLAALPAVAQEVSILDLNTDGLALNPSVYLVANQPTLDGRLFFRAIGDDGEELWVTDGTAAGTFVEDLTTGAGSSVPDYFTAVGDRLFFAARSPGTGQELWTTTGPNQASIVADLETGSGDSIPRALTAVGDILFFTAEVAGTRGLYTADSLTLDVTVASWGVVEMDLHTQLVEDDVRVYFKGTAFSGGAEEVWASDGTPSGTEQVTGLGCPELGELLGVGASVFVVCDFGSSTELFHLDPATASGVSLVHRFGDRVVNQLTPAGGTLYMNVGDDEIWAYESGSGGVSQVTSLGVNSTPAQLIRYQGDLMFVARDSAGRELYWTDGVTVTEIDIRPGGSSSTPEQLRVHDGKLYFTADDGVHGREMWISDGTVAGTEMVVDLVPGPEAPRIYLGSSTDFGLTFDIDHRELWVTEGFAGGTVEIPFPSSLATSPEELHFDDGNDQLFFVGHLDASGAEPYVTDGTVPGTVPLGDIEPGPSGSGAVFLATLPNGRTLFSATSGAEGRQLWSTEGLSGGALLTKVINPTGISHPRGVVFGEHYYFCADDDVSGNELWRSDGSTAGTELYADLNPFGSSHPCDFAVFGEALYFGAEDGVEGGLWRTNGSAAGVELVAATSPMSHGAPEELTVLGGLLYFGADNGFNGTELWRSDGTVSGTWMFFDINPGPSGSDPSSFQTAGDLLYLSADNGTTGTELWRCDGTPSGTFRIADVNPSGNSYPVPFAAINGGLVFKATGSETYHLYFTDGSPGSLTLLLSGHLWNSVDRYALWKGDLYFAAGDLGSGSTDLWRTDGTIAGTENLQLEPHTASSDPKHLAAGGGRLYVSAYDGVAKREIHILEFPLFSDGFETGDTSAW